MDSSATLGLDFLYFSTMSVFSSFTTMSVVVTNVCLVSSEYPPVFLTFLCLMVLDDMISVFDILHPVNSRSSA